MNNENFNHHHHPHHDRRGGDGVIKKQLYIRKDQLLTDIEAEIDLVADTHLMEDGSRNKIFNNVIERQKHILDRWIEKYLDKAKARMGAYVYVPEQSGAMNARRDWEEQTIYLVFPWNWNETTFSNLALSVHDYIVNSVLMEFFTMTITSKDPVTTDCQSKANDSYDDIKYQVSTRSVHTQKPLHPY